MNQGAARASEKLPPEPAADKVTMDATMGPASLLSHTRREVRSMSYAEAKEIALLRLELRACWDNNDRTGANVALARLWQIVGDDSALTAEARRWASKFA